MNLEERARKVKTEIPAVFLALKDKDTPLIAKILACLVIGYALSPIDLIPDCIPILGYLDDIILISLLINLIIKLIPTDVWARCKTMSVNLWSNGKPKKWYFAIPIILIWIIIITIVIKNIL